MNVAEDRVLGVSVDRDLGSNTQALHLADDEPDRCFRGIVIALGAALPFWAVAAWIARNLLA